MTGFFTEVDFALNAQEEQRGWEGEFDADGNPILSKPNPRKGGGAPTRHGAQPQKWPVIRFTLPGGGVVEKMIQPEEFKIEEPDGTVRACRQQLPLICECFELTGILAFPSFLLRLPSSHRLPYGFPDLAR